MMEISDSTGITEGWGGLLRLFQHNLRYNIWYTYYEDYSDIYDSFEDVYVGFLEDESVWDDYWENDGKQLLY